MKENTAENGGLHLHSLNDCLVLHLASGQRDSVIRKKMSELLEAVHAQVPAGVIIDLSQIKVFDDFLCGLLVETAQAVRLLGAGTVLSGIRAPVIMSLLDIETPLFSIPAEASVEAALEIVKEGSC